MNLDELLVLGGALTTPAVMIAFVVALLFVQRKQREQVRRDTAHCEAGAIAARLGMRVERGNPFTNLYFPGVTSLENQHIDVLLRGEQHGVPIEIVFYREVTREQGFMSVTVHRRWEARLTARTLASFGRFQVTLQQPSMHNCVRSFFDAPMQKVQTGDAHTDARLAVYTDAPALAGPLGALLAPLAPLEYVHVVGLPGEVSFLVSHSAAGRGREMIGVGYALQHAELIFDTLVRIVRAAENRA